MTHKKLLGIEAKEQSKKDILEKIKEYSKTRNSKLVTQKKFRHIVSLNPENFIEIQKNAKFRNVVTTAQIKIIDGVGVRLAGTILGIEVGERVTGVDLMGDIMEMAYRESLKVLLIGGKNKLAEELAECYRQKHKNMKLVGIEGIKDIKNIKKTENDRIFSIVSHNRPHIILAAFGSPAQELWFEANKSKLRGIVCMGVGGSFDFAAGRVKRAPHFMRKLGLEWLFRLFTQPWRIKRQLKLFEFGWLVLKEKFLGK